MQSAFLVLKKLLELIISYFDLALEHYLDNPWMKIVLAFMPALLGIAYPLVIQSVIRLDDKYHSSHIVEKFKEEKVFKRFKQFLIISVILSLASIFFSFILFISSFISLCILLYYFFKFMERLLEYQSPNKIFELLVKRIDFDLFFENLENTTRIQESKRLLLGIWHPIIDLYKYSIHTEDRELKTNIRLSFIQKAFVFIKFIEQKDSELVEFPPEFYNSSYDILATYINKNNQDYYSNLEAFVGYFFLTNTLTIDSTRQFCNKDTLSSINRNISLLIEHEQNDKIIHYWSHSHQYMESNLNVPYLRYDEKDEITELRNKIEFHQNRFLELHVVIGAYLFYKKNFKTLSRIWFFTKSTMPRYPLIPSTLNEIFELYIKFSDQTWMVSYYYIRGLDFDSIENAIDIKSVVRKYVCLLILRLWKIQFNKGKTLHFPRLPESKSLKKEWINVLNSINRVLKSLISNEKDLLNELGLSSLVEGYKQNISSPTQFIDDLAKYVDEQVENDFATELLSDDAIQKFDKFSIEILVNSLSNLRRISGNDVPKENRDPISEKMQVMRGTRMLFDREVFLEDTGTTYLFYEELLAQSISTEMYVHVSSKFAFNSKFKYRVSNGKLFEAVDKLNLNKTEHVIIAFQVNLRGYKDFFNVDLKENEGDKAEGDFFYNEISIYLFQTNSPIATNSIYIIKKSDLPMIKTKDWNELEDMPDATKERWKAMDPLNNENNLYKKFRELNTDVELKKTYLQNGKTEEELKNKVEIEIDFLGYCWFKKGVKIIEVKESDKFQEGGQIDELSKIKPFNNL